MLSMVVTGPLLVGRLVTLWLSKDLCSMTGKVVTGPLLALALADIVILWLLLVLCWLAGIVILWLLLVLCWLAGIVILWLLLVLY